MNAEQALRAAGPLLRGAQLVACLHATPLKVSYLAARGAERFVVRLDLVPARRLGLDRAREFACQRAAWAAGLAPEPLLLRTGARTLYVTRYAPGRAWAAADLADPRRLATLAGLLRRLHALPATGRRADLGAAVDRYARLAGTRAARSQAAAAHRLLAAAGLGEGAAVPCHRDATAGNIVGLRSTVLIDWEYSAPSHPLFDLAVVTAHHGLGQAAREHFWTAYLGAGQAVPRRRLAAAVRFYDLLAGLWQGAVATPGPGAFRPHLIRRQASVD